MMLFETEGVKNRGDKSNDGKNVVKKTIEPIVPAQPLFKIDTEGKRNHPTVDKTPRHP
jgi:hypothetical protein